MISPIIDPSQLAGIAEASNLRIGDTITAINGSPCDNSQSATNLIASSGGEIVLSVKRDEGTEVYVSLRRGGKSLGLVMDARNAIVELVLDSAATLHGGLKVGDRILSINGTQVEPGENIVSLFPQGEAQIDLKLLRVRMEPVRHHRSIDVPFSQQSKSTENVSNAGTGFSVRLVCAVQ